MANINASNHNSMCGTILRVSLEYIETQRDMPKTFCQVMSIKVLEDKEESARWKRKGEKGE